MMSPFQHTTTRRWLPKSAVCFSFDSSFQHTATRRWLPRIKAVQVAPVVEKFVDGAIRPRVVIRTLRLRILPADGFQALHPGVDHLKQDATMFAWQVDGWLPFDVVWCGIIGLVEQAACFRV